MKKNMKTILAGLALAVVLFAGLLAVQCHVLGQYDCTVAYVAVKNVPAGTEITEKNAGEYFAAEKVMENLANVSAITEEKELYGKYVVTAVRKGSMVYRENFRDPDEWLEQMEEPLMVSVALSSFADGVGGTLRSGDRVMIGFVNKSDGELVYWWEKPLRILESFDGTGAGIKKSDTESVASVFTIAVEEKEVQDFTDMLGKCEVIMAEVPEKGN